MGLKARLARAVMSALVGLFILGLLVTPTSSAPLAVSLTPVTLNPGDQIAINCNNCTVGSSYVGPSLIADAETYTPTLTPTATDTPTLTPTATATSSPTATSTFTATPSPTPSATTTSTPTWTATVQPTPTTKIFSDTLFPYQEMQVACASGGTPVPLSPVVMGGLPAIPVACVPGGPTWTPSATVTLSPTFTSSPTASATPTMLPPTSTETPAPSPSVTVSPTTTPTLTVTATASIASTPSVTPTTTSTPTPRPTLTPPPTFTPTVQGSPEPTITLAAGTPTSMFVVANPSGSTVNVEQVYTGQAGPTGLVVWATVPPHASIVVDTEQISALPTAFRGNVTVYAPSTFAAYAVTPTATP